MKFPTGFRLHIEIYTALRGFPETARLLIVITIIIPLKLSFRGASCGQKAKSLSVRLELFAINVNVLKMR